MLGQINENIRTLINEIITHRRNNNKMYCCGLADREDNNYHCSGDRDIPNDLVELKCSDCQTLYWGEVENEMLDKYLVKEQSLGGINE